MSRSAVDYENLMDMSFSDANNSGFRSSVRPRWERKKTAAGMKAGVQSASGAGQSILEQHRQNQHVSVTSTHGGTASSAALLQGDRFIPHRGAMNMEVAKMQLMRTASSSFCNDVEMTDASQCHNNDSFDAAIVDDKKSAYASNLSSALLGVEDLTQNRILSYTEKAPAPQGDTVSNLNVLYSAAAANSSSRHNKPWAQLVSRQIPSAPTRILDAPDLLDDYYLNLVSWSDTNVLAVALGQTVYLWNAGTGEIADLCTYETDGPNGYVTSVAWVQQGGAHLAVGVSSGATQLWDVHAGQQLRGMDGHRDRVGALAWNRHVLSSGSRDTTIVQHDVRVARHATAVFNTHTQEVCGLRWSLDGETLASGGNDNLLCLWDAAASSAHPTPRFRLTEHQAAVKALAWSPHERNLLATGGGTADRTIKFWNTGNGNVLNSIDAGSQVCALQWNPHEKEILSSHGYSRNHLCLWKYPSMAKIKELEGHTSRVLHLACSPDGGTVLSAAGDETLRFWEVFAAPAGKTRGGGTGSKKVATAGVATTKTSWTMSIR